MSRETEKVTQEDLVVLCKPSMINLFYETLINYMHSGGGLTGGKSCRVCAYISLDYETKVSLMQYLYSKWNAMFNDICNGTCYYVGYCDLLYTAINDYLE